MFNMQTYQKKWRAKNKLYMKNYRLVNTKLLSKQRKDNHANNRNRDNDRSIKYYYNNRKKISSYCMNYYFENRDRIRRYYIDYCIKNKERNALYHKQYAMTLSGRANIKKHKHNRRCMEKGLTKQVIQSIYEANIKKYKTLTCELCFNPIVFGSDSLEHFTPLSRGGNNKKYNLGVAHNICNIRKGKKTLREWFICRKRS